MGKNACSAVINHGNSASDVKALEFYSGIGGMHFACEMACKLGHIPPVEVLAAFDINPVANAVYEHNFGSIVRRNNIEAIPLKQIDEYAAQLWMLAPPCQPYTRQGLQKDINDARAHSFVSLLDKIPDMQCPPCMLLIENVVGFENSETRQALSDVLKRCGYHFQEFILSPTNFGTPYSRPRYFGLARRQPFAMEKHFHAPWTCTPQHMIKKVSQIQAPSACSLQGLSAATWLQETCQRRCIREFLEAVPSEGPELSRLATSAICHRKGNNGKDAPPRQALDSHLSCNGASQIPGVPHPKDPSHLDPQAIGTQQSVLSTAATNVIPISDENGQAEDDAWSLFRVAKPTLDKSCHCIDIVTEDMHDTNCFTKAYSRYVKGTGSVLATQNLHVLDSFPDWAHREEDSRPWYGPKEQRCRTEDERLQAKSVQELSATMWGLKLRYFSPREVANLHTFPPHFSFPADVTLKQRYSCLGNSLSVEVVAALLQYLFHGITNSD